MSMDLYRLHEVPWLDSQLFYHALARIGRSGLFILCPDAPYVCVGLHQVVEQAVHQSRCEALGLPIFRREMGGGTTLVDGNHLLCQVILPKTVPLADGTRRTFQKQLLQPFVEVCQSLGVSAGEEAVNALLVRGRKLVECGVAEIGDSLVFVGDLILDSAADPLLQVFKSPEIEGCQELPGGENSGFTSLSRELGTLPPRAELYDLVERRFAVLLGSLCARDVDEVLSSAAEDVRVRLCSPAWLLRIERRYRLHASRVRTGIVVQHHARMTPGGLIHAAVEFDEDLHRLINVFFSGDFFIYPAEAIGWLEQALENIYPEDACEALEGVYATLSLETPGITPKDWYNVLGVDS